MLLYIFSFIDLASKTRKESGSSAPIDKSNRGVLAVFFGVSTGKRLCFLLGAISPRHSAGRAS